VLFLVSLLWATALGLMLRHSLLVTYDSVSNYSHVWFVSDQIWGHHRLPYRMPVIGHGDAYAFPYSFIPWVSAALLRPLFGDWVVTLWLVGGFLGLLAATFWAFPELRSGWWAVAVLVNPIVVWAPFLGQLPFIWASAFMFAAIGCWRRDRWWLAALLAGMAQATHPAVLMPIGAALVAGVWHWEPSKRRLLTCYGLSLLIAAPAVWLVLVSPVFSDTSTLVKLVNFAGTVGPRTALFLLPFVLLFLRRTGRRSAVPLVCGLLVAGNLLFARPNGMPWAVRALFRSPDTTMLTFVDSANFVPGETYRVLRTGEGKVGMYQLIQHGARLDSEFFPESIERRSWPDVDQYTAFLLTRDVDAVIVFPDYDRVYHTNEHQLLDAAVAQSASSCVDGRVRVSLVQRSPAFDVYAIDRSGDCGG
jgi:hypothetical protein